MSAQLPRSPSRPERPWISASCIGGRMSGAGCPATTHTPRTPAPSSSVLQVTHSKSQMHTYKRTRTHARTHRHTGTNTGAHTHWHTPQCRLNARPGAVHAVWLGTAHASIGTRGERLHGARVGVTGCRQEASCVGSGLFDRLVPCATPARRKAQRAASLACGVAAMACERLWGLRRRCLRRWKRRAA